MRDTRFFLRPQYSASRALIIGINTYETASPLSYAVSDATDFKSVLIDSLNFPEENIILLTDSHATKDNILKEFLKLTSDDIGIDDRIVIFFAGHGYTRTGFRGEVGYLVPYDADSADYSTYVRWDELTRNAELVRAKHMFFIMDACYGGLAVTRSLQPGSVRFLKDMLMRYSRQVLTAGKANEVVADSGGPLAGHSVFTGHLIEGMQGKAQTPEGVITANGLMAYVYQKVAYDTNSSQTPHYGYIDGDGDLVLRAPSFDELGNDESKGIDKLISIPVVDEPLNTETSVHKIATIKRLLGDEAATIELHDFVMAELRRFLSETDADHFSMKTNYSSSTLLERIETYESVSGDLCTLMTCLAYWGKSSHQVVLQKALARLTDRLESESGTTIWLALRWYPLILQMYSAGIAAVDGTRYDALAAIFFAKTEASKYYEPEEFFVESVTRGIVELSRLETFKQIPGHERHYSPMSEYLFKTLQPRLDDLLFIGKSYEAAFDEFEVLLALVTADVTHQRNSWFWGPIGRFGWKHRSQPNSPFKRLIENAKAQRDDWPPLKARLFTGGIDHFVSVADQFEKNIMNLNWY